jgi:glycosyltransferase involved in cell wall biosynthesis
MKIVIAARESGTSTGRYVDKLIEYLHKINPDLGLMILTKSHRIDFMKKIAPHYKVQACDIKEFSVAEQTRLNKLLRSLKAELVHFSMVQQPIFYRGKVVTTMQDLTTLRFTNPSKNLIVFKFKQIVYKYVNKIAARKSKAIITPSEFVKKDILKFVNIKSEKITVTHESADRITDVPEPISGLLAKDFIVYVGRPQPHKNLSRLIDAFVLLQKKHPNLKLVLAGKKDVLFLQHEKRVVELCLKDLVFFTDFVSEGQLRWLYENCQAYVFPSLSEGFGLPGLEAMMHGAPVVSSNATCLPEIYGHAAHYFSPYSTKEMAEKIDDVLTNKTLRVRLIKQGRQQVKSYSWTQMAKKTLEVYNQALEKK